MYSIILVYLLHLKDCAFHPPVFLKGRLHFGIIYFVSSLLVAFHHHVVFCQEGSWVLDPKSFSVFEKILLLPLCVLFWIMYLQWNIVVSFWHWYYFREVSWRLNFFSLMYNFLFFSLKMFQKLFHSSLSFNSYIEPFNHHYS